jgi:hypothetical protein
LAAAHAVRQLPSGALLPRLSRGTCYCPLLR